MLSQDSEEDLIDEDERFMVSDLELDEFQSNILKSNSYKTVPVTDESEWPSALELNLDESQYIALKSAITKEFAIIQGPPGTGKTYIGLRIVQLLLHNLNAWFSNEEDSLPILIVCYTNHALDQFLEGISYLTNKIVRIGGRSSNEAVEKFHIKNLKFARRREFYDDRTYEAEEKIEKIKKKIKKLVSNHYSQSTNCIIHENVLQKYISRVQFASLKKSGNPAENKCSTKKSKMREWLEVDGFINASLNVHTNKKEYIINNEVINSKEVEIEDEADIEFIENQRNIDYYDFNNRIVLRNTSELNELDNAEYEKDWQYEILRQKETEYIKNSLQNNPTLKEERALRIKNVWMLPINERWQLYKFWLERFLEGKNEVYFNLQHDLKIACEELSNAHIEEDLWVLKDAQVVGMTTTGAAKFRHIIEARNPVVLIVEEAAEILESHIITSFSSKTKHVILIGDQQQLRPSPTVYALAVKYGMNISLFERMIMNGMEYCRLSLQHRMRPEIAALIVPHIYPDLENHEVVTKFENIKGVDKNVFFITHTFDELHVQDSKSKVNKHEARFIIRLCRHLIYQGYEPSQITVLTTYTGQLFTLKNLAAGDNVSKVRFTVVDNFQGEENDIILISFVRSNNDGDIGFLKISNRVCVALSRAKKGLYCIGNFTLLAQRSNLWKNILQTLNIKKFIGSSLRLICQNHPDLITEVSRDSDFDAIPEGGCNLKCDYRLLCGHACTLLCHTYDSGHEKFKCKKPCIKTCEIGHPCQKICFRDCKPCPVVIEKTLSKCRHTVNAPCGQDESEIECVEACKTICKEGHPCPKKCFEKCDSCIIMIDKVLSKCGHTINARCGQDESEIECLEACKTVCKEGHPCPKKCFQTCGFCEIMVDKILPKCKHSMKVACWKPKERIKCENQCGKSCKKNHLCQKKCYEICGPCVVIIEKPLSCGHVVMAQCSQKENEIKCSSECKKILPCSHQCKNKCYEKCEQKCLQLVDVKSPVCGHSFKIECCFEHDSAELAKRCLEPCKKKLHCGHICEGTCSSCKQEKKHVVCKDACQMLLLCGHLCSNKCAEPCVVSCNKMIEISSSVCGHLLNIECRFSDNLNELSRRCLNPCKKVLPCGHTCRGNCGNCYQGRVHVSCIDICNKTLICGHKCKAKCSSSCPPCIQPCENRCAHKRCPNKCGDPCVSCVKPCKWSCNHKKCTRRCNEICDRGPCNERCLKMLPCDHACVGFCGEPCPKECILCEENTLEGNSSNINEKTNGYVYLEDCKHLISEDDLRKWLVSNPSKLLEIKLKTCPQCDTVIRMNYRFNKIIKTNLSEIEKIKQVTRYNKNNNLAIQRNLLSRMNESHPNINILYKPIIGVLSGGRVRDIFELTNLKSILNIAEEIEFNVLYSMFALTPFMENLIIYLRSCREWMIDFIGKNFLQVSEYQLRQLSEEYYRLSHLSFLLSAVKQKRFSFLSPEFEKCASSLMTFSPLSDDSFVYFKKSVKNLVINIKGMPVKTPYPLEIVNMSALWYRCSKDHIICFARCLETSKRNDCYKCEKVTGNKKLPRKTKIGAKNYSEEVDDFNADEAFDDMNMHVFDDASKNISKTNSTVMKLGPPDQNSNVSAEYNPGTRRKFHVFSEFQRKSAISKYGCDKDIGKFDEKNRNRRIPYFPKTATSIGSEFPNTYTKRRNEHFSNPPWTYQKPTSNRNVSRKNTEKKSDGKNYGDRSGSETFSNSSQVFKESAAKSNTSNRNAKNTNDGKFLDSRRPYKKAAAKSRNVPSVNSVQHNEKDLIPARTSPKPKK